MIDSGQARAVPDTWTFDYLRGQGHSYSVVPNGALSHLPPGAPVPAPPCTIGPGTQPDVDQDQIADGETVTVPVCDQADQSSLLDATLDAIAREPKVKRLYWFQVQDENDNLWVLDPKTGQPVVKNGKKVPIPFAHTGLLTSCAPDPDHGLLSKPAAATWRGRFHLSAPSAPRKPCPPPVA